MTEITKKHRNTMNYYCGFDSYEEGYDVSACPHTSGTRRLEWLTGFYDARTNDRIGHVLKKYGLTHP